MKTKTILFETLCATVLGAILALVALFSGMTAFVVIAPMFVIVVASARNGATFGFRVGLFVSALLSIGVLMKNGSVQPFDILVYQLYQYTAIVIGFFAKNIHRNLNNKKMKTVQLNVVAAQVISALVIILLSFIYPDSGVTLLDGVVYGVSSSALILVLAYIKPRTILTNRSRYLTSKERSKLLND